jgi:hypothetical protein
MPIGSKQTEEQQQSAQQTNVDIRYHLQNAYAFIEGQKSNQTFSAFTPEEAHDRFIERIEGKSTPFRPNVLERIDRVVQNVVAVVAQVKALPSEAFRRSTEDDVNTPEETTE